MEAFASISWPVGDGAAEAEALSFRNAFARQYPDAPRLEAPGLCLMDLSPAPHSRRLLPLPVGGTVGGAIFGTLFRRSGGFEASPPLSELTAAEALRIIRSQGKALADDYWGSYIGVLATGSGSVIVADPTGAIPCFHTRRGQVSLAFSNLEMCSCLGWRHATINYAFVRKLLVYDKIQTGETGIEGVFELLAGHRVEPGDPPGAGTLLWDPRSPAAEVLDLPRPEAVALLRRMVRHVVHAWARVHGPILLNLSGGLDSSIVAACLGELERSDIEAVHFRLVSEDPPEAHYAARAAAATRMRLHEVAIDPARPLPEPLDHPLSARPWRQFIALDHAAAMGSDLLRSRPALFSGQGGDHLFYETRSPLILADYIRHHGAGAALPSHLLGAARLSGRSIWSVWAAVLAGWRENSHARAYARMLDARRGLVNQRAFDRLEAGDLLPVWAREPGGLPPAKFEQVASLHHMVQVRDTFPREGLGPACHPLISQPLMEFCLRLPSYALSPDGISRGLARLAFEGLVPDEVRLRRTKGSASQFFMSRIQHARDQIVSVLRDGMLVQEGLIRKSDVEAFMQAEGFMRAPAGRTMLTLYAIEAWLQRWKAYLSQSPP